MSNQTEGLDSVPRNNSEKMTSFRRENIGYVFQFFNLLQDLTVLENILLIQELAGKKDPARAKELLKLVGLEAEVDRFPGEISGGQQQRVAIARSIAKRPTLLLGDELTVTSIPRLQTKLWRLWLVHANKKTSLQYSLHGGGWSSMPPELFGWQWENCLDEQTNNESLVRFYHVCSSQQTFGSQPSGPYDSWLWF